jgi:hypothetical protein
MTDNYLNLALEQPKYFDFAFLIPNPTLVGASSGPKAATTLV